MAHKYGVGPDPAVTEIEAQKSSGTGKRRRSFKSTFPHPQAWSLYRGRSHKPLVRVVPDTGSPLYRIIWPDAAPSPLVNLSRARDAAEQWAEQQVLTERRNLSVAQRLKLLGNFWWSPAPVRQNEAAAAKGARISGHLWGSP
jgi:hypothetical protein